MDIRMDDMGRGGGGWWRWDGVFRNDDIVIIIIPPPPFPDIDKRMVPVWTVEEGWRGGLELPELIFFPSLTLAKPRCRG